MVDAHIVTNLRKVLMFIMYMDLIIKSMMYYALTAMLNTMEMTKFLIIGQMIQVAKIVVRLVPGRKLKIDGGLRIQMGRFMFVST